MFAHGIAQKWICNIEKNGSLIPIDFFPIHIGIREMNARVPLFTNIFLFANEYQMNRAGKNELTFD